MLSSTSDTYTIEDSGTSLIITIPHRKRQSYVLAGIAATVIGIPLEILIAIALGVTLLETVKGHPSIGLGGLAFLTAMLIVGGLSVILLGICSIMWEYDGREIIEVNDTKISTRWQSYNLSRQKDYAAEHVTHLRCPKTKHVKTKRTHHLTRRSVFQRHCNGTIALDYNGMSYLFGCKLDETEAERVVKEIRERFPSYL